MTVLSLIAKKQQQPESALKKMNKTVESMVHAALQCNGVESVLNAKESRGDFFRGFSLKSSKNKLNPTPAFNCW